MGKNLILILNPQFKMEKIYEAIRGNDAFKSVSFSRGDNKINLVTQTNIDLLIKSYSRGRGFSISEYDGGWHVIHSGKADNIIKYINE
jgi:hypothetical protein